MLIFAVSGTDLKVNVCVEPEKILAQPVNVRVVAIIDAVNSFFIIMPPLKRVHYHEEFKIFQ